MLEPADGSELQLRAAVTIAGDELTIDFAGTAAQHDGNLNCPLAVTRSACYFVVRCLTDPDVPASGGAFAPVHVTAPEGSPRQRPPSGGRRRRQRRDLEPDRRRRLRRLRSSRSRARAGTGNDEQPHARERPLHLLRDGRRGPGRLPRRRRPLRGARRDVEHALDARPRRSSSAIRCGSSAMSCGSARAVAGEHRGGDGVVRELRVLEACRLSLVGERRDIVRAGRTEASRAGRRTRPAERRAAPGQGHARRSLPATWSGSRRPAAAASALSKRANRQPRRNPVGPCSAMLRFRHERVSHVRAGHAYRRQESTGGARWSEVHNGKHGRGWWL